MHILGLHGMTRRIYTYVAETGWGNLNLLATIGAGIIGVSVLLFVVNVASALRRSVFADANPWQRRFWNGRQRLRRRPIIFTICRAFLMPSRCGIRRRKSRSWSD